MLRGAFDAYQELLHQVKIQTQKEELKQSLKLWEGVLLFFVGHLNRRWTQTELTKFNQVKQTREAIEQRDQQQRVRQQLSDPAARDLVEQFAQLGLETQQPQPPPQTTSSMPQRIPTLMTPASLQREKGGATAIATATARASVATTAPLASTAASHRSSSSRPQKSSTFAKTAATKADKARGATRPGIHPSAQTLQPETLSQVDTEADLRKLWLEGHPEFQTHVFRPRMASTSALMNWRPSTSQPVPSPPPPAPPGGPVLQQAPATATTAASVSEVQSLSLWSRNSSNSSSSKENKESGGQGVHPMEVGLKWCITAAETLFIPLAVMILSRNESIGAHGSTIQPARLLPRLCTQPTLAVAAQDSRMHQAGATAATASSYSASAPNPRGISPSPPTPVQHRNRWLRFPSFDSMAWPVLRRLRLWCSQHSRSSRQVSSWPTTTDLRDMELLLSILILYHWPRAMQAVQLKTNSTNSKSNSSESESSAASSWQPHWGNDEEAFRQLKAWYPPELKVLDDAKRLEDERKAEEEKKRRVPMLLPSEWAEKLNQTMPITAAATTTVGPLMIGGVSISSSSSSLSSSLRMNMGPVAPIDLPVAGKDETKMETEASEKIITGTEDSLKASDEGRWWDDESIQTASVPPPVLWLGEVTNLLQSLLLQEHYLLSGGVIVPPEKMPLIKPAWRSGLREVIRRASTLESGDDDWKRDFRTFVFEHAAPLASKASYEKRNTLDMNRANARVSATAQMVILAGRELGLQIHEHIENLMEKTTKLDMCDEKHELHELYLLKTFATLVMEKTHDIIDKPANQARNVDFLGLYYQAPHHFNKASAAGVENILFRKKRRGQKRRPILYWICHRWMIHDIQPQSVNATEGGIMRGTSVGNWYDYGDNLLDALITWCWLIEEHYHGEVEDATPLHTVYDLFGMEYDTRMQQETERKLTDHLRYY